jgi:hypothetical protein
MRISEFVLGHGLKPTTKFQQCMHGQSTTFNQLATPKTTFNHRLNHVASGAAMHVVVQPQEAKNKQHRRLF